MKWLIPVGGLILAGWFAWFQLNTTKISYVNGLAPYDVMPGREYILQHDCYVFAWHKSIATAYPLLGVNHPAVRTSLAALPKDVRADLVGTPQPLVRLMNMIPQGTRFKLLSVRREQSRRTGTFISYEIKFLDEVDRPYQRIDIRPLLLPTERPGDVPQIDETIAVPWIKR
ncbi:MAG: hypothetical protein WCR49_03295 [Opitutae bacterium]